MKVIECRDFKPEYPESFTWGHVDSILASNLSADIVNRITHDLRKADRNLVPGLRHALVLLAGYADI